MKLSNTNSLLWLVVLIIAACSYFFLGAACAQVQLYGSDQAVHVLMAHKPNLPEGLYLWGQHRLGSLMPLLAHALYLFLPISPAPAVSFIQVLVPLFTIWLLRNDFQNKFKLLLFSSLLLLPPLCFASLIQSCNNFSSMLLCIAITYKLLVSDNKIKIFSGNILNNTSLAFVSIVGIWLSETYVLFLMVLAIFSLREISSITFKNRIATFALSINLINCIIFITTIFLGIGFILYAKSVSFGQEVDNSFVNSKDFLEVIKICKGYFFESLTFTPELPTHFAEGFLLMLFGGFIFIHYIISLFKIKTDSNPIWQHVIFWTMVANLVFYFLSKWSLMNGMAVRYLTPVYFLGLLYLLSIEFNNTLQRILLFFGFLLAFSNFGTYITLRFIPFYTPSYMECVAPIGENFGKCTIIGDYWVVYSVASSNPELITPIPSQSSFNRSPWTTDVGMDNEVILVSKENLMTYFPDTLREYNYTLVRYKDTLDIAHVWPNRYIRVPYEHTFNAVQWQHGYGELRKDSSTNLDYLYASKASKDLFLNFGPYVPLTKGNFVAEINAEISEFNNDDSSFIEIYSQSADVLSNKVYLNKVNCTMNSIKIPFTLSHSYPTGVEFRFKYRGNGEIKLHSLKIKELRTWKYPWEIKS